MSVQQPTLVVRRRAIDGPPFASRELESAMIRPQPLARLAASSLATFCVSASAPEIAVTYDDGPHPVHTPRILDVLAEHDTHATFFVLAQPAAAHPEIIRCIVDGGHELALHGPDHQSLLERSTQEAVQAVTASRTLVEDVAGVPLRFYRPPYGQHTPAQARAIHRSGLDLVVWSGDPRDWVDDTESNIVDRAMGQVFPGAILLLHDDRADPHTLGRGERLPAFDRAKVLDELLSRARDAGFRATTVGGLFSRHARVKSFARERSGR